MPKRTSSQRPGAPPITRTRVVIPRLGEQAFRFAPLNPNPIARLPDPIFQFAPLIRDQTSSGYRPVVPIQQPPSPAEVSSDDESYTADESYDSSVQFDDENDDQSDENDDQSDEDDEDDESEDEMSVDETTDWTDQGDDDHSMPSASR